MPCRPDRPSTTLRRGAGAGAAVLLLAVAGCGPSPEEEGLLPIQIRSVDTGDGPMLDLDLPLHESGAFEFEQWPSACKLIDEDLLRGIFPQADEVRQTPSALEVEVTGFGYDGDPGPFTIPEASCLTDVGFPVDGLRLEDENIVVRISSEVVAAGDPVYVERNTTPTDGDPLEVDGMDCVAYSASVPTNTAVECRADSLVFTLNVDARPYAQYLDRASSSSVFDVDGDSIDAGEDMDAFWAMVEDSLVVPIGTHAAERVQH